MQEEQNLALPQLDRKRRLKLIIIAHLLIVGSFFVATFFWGNFS